MRDTKNTLRILICLFWLALFGFSGCQYTGRAVSDQSETAIPGAETAGSEAVEISQAEQVESTPVEIPEEILAGPDIFGAVYESIYQGEFDTASGLIKYYQRQLDPLAEIVAEYQVIKQRRQRSRKARYEEQLAKLEEFRRSADISEMSDINDISKALSVVAKASEFADEEQKAELLSEPFTQQIFQEAIEKADELESKGEWLDAYAMCYSWLQAIDEENEAYSDYAEQLIEKASIAASFQDSPCESREERYEGVEKKVFIWAIDALRYNYVNSLIDYRQMAVEAIRRCELLVEVLRSVPEGDYSLPDLQDADSRRAFSAWSRGLAAISDEIAQSHVDVSRDKFIDIFEEVLELNATTVELPPSLLISHFAESSLSALDPYTVIVWPKQVQDFEKLMTNEFTGIGIEISKEKGLLKVVSLLPGTPAYHSGLDAEDVIEKVDGVETKDMSLSCAVKNITGPEGTKVKLTVRRPNGDETRDITITRARITVPTIRGWQRTTAGRWRYMIDDRRKIGYVRITNFSEKTASDLERVLNGLERAGLNGLILDLRFNSGGLLNIAVEVADKFLEEGPIVITRPRYWVSSTHAMAKKKGTHPDYPIVVLINHYSASASEIVAGALADPVHNQAILVGERTHGKGSVQGIVGYPRGDAHLKYTMAYYYLPSGQRVKSRDEAEKEGREDWGVEPDIKIELRSDEIRNMFDVQRDNDVLVKADHDKEAVPLKKHTVEESLAADPQLAVALLVVRSRLIQESSGI